MTTRQLLLLIVAAMLASAQRDNREPPDPLDRPDVRLPNGKSQRDEIVKSDHKRNQEDAAKLAQLSAELRQELDAQESHIVSVKMIRKVEEIERLTRNIRGRLKRN